VNLGNLRSPEDAEIARPDKRLLETLKGNSHMSLALFVRMVKYDRVGTVKHWACALVVWTIVRSTSKLPVGAAGPVQKDKLRQSTRTLNPTTSLAFPVSQVKSEAARTDSLLDLACLQWAIARHGSLQILVSVAAVK
jgi:hypothetical protein